VFSYILTTKMVYLTAYSHPSKQYHLIVTRPGVKIDLFLVGTRKSDALTVTTRSCLNLSSIQRINYVTI